MHNRVLLGLLLLVIPLIARGEVLISGVVVYRTGGMPVDLANVIIEDPDTDTVIGYTTTNAEGRFSVKITTSQPTIKIIVSGFNLVRESYLVDVKTQELCLKVDYHEMDLPEAVIKTRPIRHNKDTLVYYVAQFSDSLDRSISDVLGKMPGITVDKSGGIRYHGKKIDYFYIEGMDLMGERYGLATHNVRAQDVAAVEVYENHQPVKLLQSLFGGSTGGQVAVNLKLKDNAKGAVVGTAEIGGGLPLYQWDAGATGMYFSSYYQMLTSLRSNDIGRDIISEIKEQGEGSPMLTPYINVYLPSTPQLGTNRYMDNMTHAASFNNLFKISNEQIMSLNGIYSYDKQFFSGHTVTRYYLPEDNPLIIDEIVQMKSRKQEANARIKYTYNGAKRYVDNTFFLNYGIEQNEGDVMTNGQLIDQQLNGDPSLSLKNQFQVVRAMGKKNTLSWNSEIQISSLPMTLEIHPVLYPSLFGNVNAQGSRQEMNIQSINVRNTVSTFFFLSNRLTMSVVGGHSILKQKSRSTLSPFPDVVFINDSLRNDIRISRHIIHSNLLLSYRYQRLKAFGGFDVDMTFLDIDDMVQNKMYNKIRPLFHPFVSFELSIAHNNKLYFNSSLQESFGPFSDYYSGYVMTDYRHISSHSVIVGENITQRYNLDWKNTDALSSRFLSVSSEYWRSCSNVMYDTSFDGFISHIDNHSIDNVSQGWKLQGRYSRFFDVLRSTFEMTAGYSQTWLEVLRQGVVVPASMGMLTSSLKIIVSPNPYVKIRYDADVLRHQSIYDHNTDNIAVRLSSHQQLAVEGLVAKTLTVKLLCEHYYNSVVVKQNQHIGFLDAAITWKLGSVELAIEGRNLFNTNTYAWCVNEEATEYESYYDLRSRMFLLRVRISR